MHRDGNRLLRVINVQITVCTDYMESEGDAADSEEGEQGSESDDADEESKKDPPSFCSGGVCVCS